MTRLVLPALLGSHPLAALCSFGLLRWVSEADPTAKLEFANHDDWVACLHSSVFTSERALVAAVAQWLETDALDRLIGWGDDVRVSPEDYRCMLQTALEDTSWELARFLSALVAEGAVDAQKGLVKPSAFYMVSGQQSFFAGIREILRQVRKAPEPSTQEALLGPWRYQTKAHGLGWDPNTERLYALRHRAPTSEKPSCIAGAVLMAFWALPMMPALSVAQRPVTIGFSRVSREQSFLWPVFSRAIGLGELRSLLHAGPQRWVRPDGSLRTGIETIYRSVRSEFGQGYAVLKPAKPYRITSVIGT